MIPHVHQPPPDGVLLEQEERIPLAGRPLEVADPPAGYRHLPDLGIIALDCLDVRRLHAFPPPNDMSEPVRALKTPGGDLLAITQSGSGHMINNRDKINELLAYRSGAGGATWHGPSHPWEVSYNQHGFNPMVPRGSTQIVAFGTEPTAELFLPPHDGGVGMRRSDDDGHTWSETEIIDPVNSPGYLGVGHMRGCEMDSGAWLLPTYSVRRRTNGWPNRTDTQYVLRSEDQGANWTLIPGPHPHGWQMQPWKRTLEGTILSPGGSEAVMFARVPSGRMWELRSADDGRTWSDPEPTVLRHPDAPPMVFWLGDGSTMVALIHNQGSGDWRGQADRRELWACLSRDEGRSWSPPRLLLADTTVPCAAPSTRDPKRRVELSYADLVVDGDRLHLFLDHQKRQIFHIMLMEADLSAGATEQDLGG